LPFKVVHDLSCHPVEYLCYTSIAKCSLGIGLLSFVSTCWAVMGTILQKLTTMGISYLGHNPEVLRSTTASELFDKLALCKLDYYYYHYYYHHKT